MKRRSEIQDFEWNTHCLLCGDILDFNCTHPNRNRTHKAEIPSTSSIRAVCKCMGEAWAAEVELQLPGCIVVAAEAEYHRQCRQNFYSNRSNPIKSKSDKKKAAEKHKDEHLHNGFIQLCAWLEQQIEAFTMKELEEKMKRLTESGKSYSSKWIGQKLTEHYQDLVYFVSKLGIATKVFFTDIANSTLSDAWYEERKNKIQEENLRVTSAVARLLLNEM